MKITGGSLKVKALLSGPGWEEKADQLRIYSGAKFQAVDEAAAGTVCAVTGLSAAYPGQGLGAEPDAALPVLEPVLTEAVHSPDMEHIPYPVTEDILFEAMQRVEAL